MSIFTQKISKNHAYSVEFVDNVFGSQSGRLISYLSNRKLIAVTTPTVKRLYGEQLLSVLREHNVACPILCLPIREKEKIMSSALKIVEFAHKNLIDREGTILVFGGGLITDVVTVAASLIRRGVNYVCLPTTLIAQVDAAVGIKGSVNYNNAKNYLGCYYPPHYVVVDPNFLRTLSNSNLRQGLAEMLKMALIRDAQLFESIERFGVELIESKFQSPARISRNILTRSVELMLGELGTNIFEDQSYKRRVDMGHTISPILESKSGFRLPHGEAVAIDMAYSCCLAVELQKIDIGSAERFIACMQSIGLPILCSDLSMDSIREALKNASAHRGGSINMVIPTEKLGSSSFIESKSELDERAMGRALDRLRNMSFINSDVSL